MKDDWSKTFAIKVVNIRGAVKQFHGDKERMEKYMDYERGILGNLTHENIVKLVYFYKSENSYYLIFEYVAGADLRTYIRAKGPLPEVDAQRFFRQIVNAIRQLQALMISHRDLKPENVLLTKPDKMATIKICDFGMARKAHDQNLLDP